MAFIKYTYSAGATVANLMSDIAALLTGETNKANLSAACDQANTTITSTEAAGWTSHDASAGTNKRVFSAPCVDTSTKYAMIDLNTAGSLYMPLYETWNAGSHTGTNAAPNSTAAGPSIDTTAGGTLYIAVSNRYLLIASYISGTWGTNGPYLVAERDRVDPWDTYANGYPVSVWTRGSYIESVNGANSQVNFFSPRIKDTATDRTGSTSYGYVLTTAFSSSNATAFVSAVVPTQTARDANFVAKHVMLPMYMRANNNLGHTHFGGKVQGGLYLTTSDNGSPGDEITYNSAQYFIFRSGTAGSMRLAVPKW